MRKMFFTLLIFSGIGTIATAQQSFQAHFGIALPTGRFASSAGDFVEGSGNAATGITAGLKAILPLRQEGLSFTAGIDFFYNGWNADYKASVDDNFFSAESYSKYINIPITAGIEYNSPLSNELALFGTFGLGANILKITSLSAYDKFEDATYVVKFSPSIKMAYRLGGGVVLKDKYILGLQYYGLGSHKVKYGDGYDEVDKFTENFERPLAVGALTLTFGIKF